MSKDKLEIQFVLFAMLRIHYKRISQLMLIRLAASVVLMRKERSEEAVMVVDAMFVISFIYLAGTPQAVGIWLMIIRVHIRSLFHPQSFSHRVWSSSILDTFHFRRALPNLILVRSCKLPYNPKVKDYFLCLLFFFLQLHRDDVSRGGVVLWMYCL